GGGGQGALVAGAVMGRAAVIDGLYASQASSYGAEARGTLSLCEVVVSDEPIDYPFAHRLDALAVMSSKASRVVRRLKPRGLLVVDWSVELQAPAPSEARVVRLRAFKEAEEKLGRALLGNLVLVGALSRLLGLPSLRALERAVVLELPEDKPRLREAAGPRAIRLGFELAGLAEPLR
ncbi:MAG: 2-oxoacid:acceptor oxidoreductase family protein, partial [Candidatus Nezhaarchaeota archaeon]|nr:2-oxoacid:acceptor oxidoreductase family protein [Candidatus Nezhaarchaeota archaeon]